MKNFKLEQQPPSSIYLYLQNHSPFLVENPLSLSFSVWTRGASDFSPVPVSLGFQRAFFQTARYYFTSSGVRRRKVHHRADPASRWTINRSAAKQGIEVNGLTKRPDSTFLIVSSGYRGERAATDTPCIISLPGEWEEKREAKRNEIKGRIELERKRNMDVARNTSNGLTGDERWDVSRRCNFARDVTSYVSNGVDLAWEKKKKNIALREWTRTTLKSRGKSQPGSRKNRRSKRIGNYSTSRFWKLYSTSPSEGSLGSICLPRRAGWKKAGRNATHVTEQSPLAFLYGYNRSCLLSFRRSFPFRSEPHAHTCAAWRSPCTVGYPKTVQESWCRLLASKRTGNCAQGGLRNVAEDFSAGTFDRRILKFD